MDKQIKDNIILKILSLLGIGFNTILLLAILLHGLNLFTFILISLCIFGIYYPVIKLYKANKVSSGSDDVTENNINKNYGNTIKNEPEIKSAFSNDIDEENKINVRIIDDLKLRNIELTNKIEDIVRKYDKEVSNLEYILETADFEHKLDLANITKEYEDKIRLLEKQIEDMTILTDEKRNELKEEALFEYLSLMKEDYHKRLNGDKEDVKPESVSTYVAGVKYTNPYGENRQKIIKDYIKEHHDINLFDENDFYYVSNKEIEEESGYVSGKKYYQYELEEFDTIRLDKEPDNPHDENAIGIIHEVMGHIGYIPKEDINEVKKIMECGQDLLYRLKLFGGRYKYFDEYDYKVKFGSKAYYFDLLIECV